MVSNIVTITRRNGKKTYRFQEALIELLLYIGSNERKHFEDQLFAMFVHVGVKPRKENLASYD